MTDDEIRQQAQDSYDANPAYGTDLPIPHLQSALAELQTENAALRQECVALKEQVAQLDAEHFKTHNFLVDRNEELHVAKETIAQQAKSLDELAEALRVKDETLYKSIAIIDDLLWMVQPNQNILRKMDITCPECQHIFPLQEGRS